MRKPASTDAYRAAAGLLRPWALANGFVGPRDTRRPGPWSGERTGTAVSFALQADKNGWDERDGGRFTVNFEACVADEMYRPRFAKLLRRRPLPSELAMSPTGGGAPAFAEADRTAFAELSRRVIAQLPAPGEHGELDTMLDALSGDPWMRFWDTTDVAAWMSTFFVPRLPRMLDALILGPPKPAPPPKLDLPSLAVAREGGRLVLRVAEPDARRLRDLLRVPWRAIIAEGPSCCIVLEQTHAVRGPLNEVDLARREIRWRLGRSTRAALIEVLEGAEGARRVVEDHVGSARFDTGVVVEVRA